MLDDHPVVRNLERTGYPDGKEPKPTICPACGAEAEYFFSNDDGDILGCDCCVTRKDAWEVAC